MRIERAVTTAHKGWYAAGGRNPALSFVIGYASQGVNEPHVHSQITEVYLVARGTAEVRVEKTTIALVAGDMLELAPGEAHTFLSSSSDYFHFVIHSPVLAHEAAEAEKAAVAPARLGL